MHGTNVKKKSLCHFFETAKICACMGEAHVFIATGTLAVMKSLADFPQSFQ